jgi:hypothetical protein
MRMRPLLVPTILPAIMLAAAPIGARAPAAQDPASSHALDTLLACKAMTDAAQRLACYDSNVAQLQTATARRDIVVVDRNEVREARHSLFGFNLPTLAIFGNDGKDKSSPVVEEEKEINATIQSARQDGQGNWLITLDNGAVWRQTDGVPQGYTPRAGMAVTVRRAALGSYFMRVGKWPGFKAKREG